LGIIIKIQCYKKVIKLLSSSDLRNKRLWEEEKKRTSSRNLKKQKKKRSSNTFKNNFAYNLKSIIDLDYYNIWFTLKDKHETPRAQNPFYLLVSLHHNQSRSCFVSSLCCDLRYIMCRICILLCRLCCSLSSSLFYWLLLIKYYRRKTYQLNNYGSSNFFNTN
jgi:hypothetical protein